MTRSARTSGSFAVHWCAVLMASAAFVLGVLVPGNEPDWARAVKVAGPGGRAGQEQQRVVRGEVEVAQSGRDTA